MKRDELIRRISALPQNVDIGVQIGAESLDIIELVAWGEGGYVGLTCHPNDLRDLSIEWDLSAEQRARMLGGPERRPT